MWKVLMHQCDNRKAIPKMTCERMGLTFLSEENNTVVGSRRLFVYQGVI